MARWKARVEFLLSVSGLLFLSLSAEVLQGKTCQNSLLSEGVGHLEPRFQGEGVVTGEYFLVSTKLDTFCYLTVQTEPCYVPLFWHNTGVWQTDRLTDRRNCRSWYSAGSASIAAHCKKFKMTAAGILKNRKIAIFQQSFYWSPRNLARWHSLALLSVCDR